MANSDEPSPSFSASRRWLATLNMTVGSIALLSLLVMVNYLAQGHFRRVPLADATNFKLSQQTVAVLNSLTNDVRITIFYTHRADVYSMVTSLLSEYQHANPAHLQVISLDYDRSPGDAAKLLTRLHLGPNQKDFVAFECEGRHKICRDDKLSGYDLRDLLPKGQIHRNSFLGEVYFTSDIFAVTHPSDLKAYFLTGHGERNPGDATGAHTDYTKFAAILTNEISCAWTNLTLTETDAIPADCSLLIIASGTASANLLSTNELAQIQTYLQHSGRLLALLDVSEGLDPVLKNWDIVLGTNNILDSDKRVSLGGDLYRVYPAMDPSNPSSAIHPIMMPLVREGFYIKMFAPHPVYSTTQSNKPRDPGAATFAPVAATTNGTIRSNDSNLADRIPGRYTLVAAIEKNVITEHGGTRILVAGDSDFLDDQLIDDAANHYFATQTLDWLLQRPDLLSAGIRPRAIREYTVSLTDLQTTQVRWLFLGAMPGSILVLGGLVWLRRRK